MFKLDLGSYVAFSAGFFLTFIETRALKRLNNFRKWDSTF